MKAFALETITRTLFVQQNEDGSLLIAKKPGEASIPNAGALILNFGGIPETLARCTELNESFDDYVAKRAAQKQTLREIEKQVYMAGEADRMAKLEKQEAEEEAEWNELAALPVIPATVPNIRKVLRHLNKQNWGSWTLPALSIGYSAHQYDCDGRIATTITLDQPISDEESGIINETRFSIGGKRGHLNRYQSL
ncbi:MAG: hypothetical protein EOM73_03245 [Bacteroidia bacterium]|nr:hypothetical protein [Bacteroidia bacterium]